MRRTLADGISIAAVRSSAWIWDFSSTLNRITDNLDDCLGNVKTIAGQAGCHTDVGRIIKPVE